MTNFDRAFEIIVGVEGGYVNDPNDPGGETKYGITARDNPTADIKNLTLDQAKAIYAAKYWTPAGCEYVAPWPLSLYLFDCAVNQGVDAAIRLLQKSVGAAQDGILGIATEKAVAAKPLDELCNLFMADRALRYTGTRNFDIYGRGWFKRLFKLRGIPL